MLSKNTVQFEQLTHLELEIRVSDVTPFHSFLPSYFPIIITRESEYSDSVSDSVECT